MASSATVEYNGAQVTSALNQQRTKFDHFAGVSTHGTLCIACCALVRQPVGVLQNARLFNDTIGELAEALLGVEGAVQVDACLRFTKFPAHAEFTAIVCLACRQKLQRLLLGSCLILKQKPKLLELLWLLCKTVMWLMSGQQTSSRSWSSMQRGFCLVSGAWCLCQAIHAVPQKACTIHGAHGCFA